MWDKPGGSKFTPGNPGKDYVLPQSFSPLDGVTNALPTGSASQRAIEHDSKATAPVVSAQGIRMDIC